MTGTLRQSGRPLWRTLAIALAVAASLALSACAGNESYPNDPKPPAVLTVTTVVGEDEISASPNPFGAGPTRFIITNQTGTKQIITISTDQFDRKVLVDKQQTVNFKQTVQPGFLSIDTSNSAADALEITVGPKRPSAQQDLDQP
ncbi:MAG: hypothetical protein ACRDKI_07120 [Solirubrobacterales bacterium]